MQTWLFVPFFCTLLFVPFLETRVIARVRSHLPSSLWVVISIYYRTSAALRP